MLGKTNTGLLNYVAEIAKVFNKASMSLLNQEKFKISNKIFKHLIRILKEYEGP
jgi:hypothetical protein